MSEKISQKQVDAARDHIMQLSQYQLCSISGASKSGDIYFRNDLYSTGFDKSLGAISLNYVKVKGGLC